LQPIATVSALIMTVNMMVWLVLLRLPRVVTSPASSGMWLGFGETVLLVCGGWILLARSLTTIARHETHHRRRQRPDRTIPGCRCAAGDWPGAFRVGRATAQLVPAWLRPGWIGLLHRRLPCGRGDCACS